MDQIASIIEIIVRLFENLIPVFNINDVVVQEIDKAFVIILMVFNKIDYFVDLNVLMACLYANVTCRGWVFSVGVVKYFAELIRG